ncbi:MAG TPA: hypothetical protein VK524_01880 [Polyangiaceae bacterium]|nr:hypothetical protein [Polyangiaceae bacterium]
MNPTLSKRTAVRHGGVLVQRAAKAAVLVVAALTSACSFTRFGDLEEDTPVVLLKKPGKLSSFGVSLSSFTRGERTDLLVGGAAGASPAAVFSLGSAENPGVDAKDTGYCDGGDDRVCYLGTSTAPMLNADIEGDTSREFCFALGIGSTPGLGNGIAVRCADHTEFVLPVPDNVKSELVDPAVLSDEPEHVALASDGLERPTLLVGAASERFSWAYAPGGRAPMELVPPVRDESFGTSVAVVKLTSSFIFAVAAPDQGHVWLFRGSAPDISAGPIGLVGCLGTVPGLGRALSTGRINADDQDDLVISDATNVSVFDGARLGQLDFTSSSECSIGSLPQGALLASFTCGSTGDLSGCANSDFGASLAIGDLDGDGDGEVVVGAPHMTARDSEEGGAVLVYDVEGANPHALGDAKFLASAEEGDQLGSSVATPRIGDRHIIAAGAPGGGKTALFYCSGLRGARGGSRCR